MTTVTFSIQTLQSAISSLILSKFNIENQITFFKDAAQKDAAQQNEFIYFSAVGILEDQLLSIESALAELQAAYTHIIENLSDSYDLATKPTYTMDELKDDKDKSNFEKYQISIDIVK